MARNIVVPLVIVAASGAAIWAGITDPTGGTFAGLRRLLRNEPAQKTPANGAAFLPTLNDLAAVTTPAVATTGGATVTPAAALTTPTTPTPAATGVRGAVLTASAGWLGTPYAWGRGTKAGADCSGFTQTLFHDAAGIDLPRVSAAQALVGTKRTAATAQPGDLVFFGFPVHHVGLLIAPGTIRHAPHAGRVISDERIWSTEPVQYRDVLTSSTAKKKTKRKTKRKTVAT